VRPQDNENTRKPHILDIDFLKRNDELDYILAIRENVTQVLSSPETRVLFDVLYDREFGLSNLNDETDKAIGPVLYREQESIDDVHSYKSLVRIYLDRDINKFFGLSLDEFLNLSRYARMMLVDLAEEQMIKIDERLKALKEDADANAGDLTNFMDGLDG